MSSRLEQRLWICVVVCLLVLAACGPVSSAPALPGSGNVSVVGTVRTGAELGEIKGYCPQGLFLVADEGSYLTGQTTILLLREADGQGGTRLLDDKEIVDRSVRVTGRYPAQEVFCEALICDCEDFILVETITPAPE